jgi:acetyltransferase-like isoleucine patch superfamily enzyme
MMDKLNRNNLSWRNYFIYICSRGIAPLIRGLSLFFINFDAVKFPFFRGKGVRIHHSHLISSGSGFYVGDYSYINCLSVTGLRVGKRVTIREFCWLQMTSSTNNLGEGISIGDYTYIGPRCNLGAAAMIIIGNNCQIGAGVSFIAENHLFESNKSIFGQGVSRKGIRVGDDCWMGNNVVILDGVTIGQGVVIGASSVVTKDLPDGAVAVGVPARIISIRHINS